MSNVLNGQTLCYNLRLLLSLLGFTQFYLNSLQTAVSMLNDVVHDFVAMVEGYFHLFIDNTKVLLRTNNVHSNNNTDPNGEYKSLIILYISSTACGGPFSQWFFSWDGDSRSYLQSLWNPKIQNLPTQKFMFISLITEANFSWAFNRVFQV